MAALAYLGQLVSGVAHELNTPLGALNSSTDAIRRTVKRVRSTSGDSRQSGAAKIERRLELIDQSSSVLLDASGRISEVVRKLQDFAHVDEAERQQMNLNDCVEHTLHLLHHQAGDRVRIVRRLSPVPRVLGSPGELNQVLMNVLLNALQAIEGNGRIEIVSLVDDEHVVLRISDSGKGITAEDLERIFDPGFTKKGGVRVRAGLGLAIAYNIMQSHNGSIEIHSEPAKGSCVTLTLPVGAGGEPHIGHLGR